MPSPLVENPDVVEIRRLRQQLANAPTKPSNALRDAAIDALNRGLREGTVEPIDVLRYLDERGL